jgi:hypothetical protein
MELHVRNLTEQAARGTDSTDEALRRRAYHEAGHAAMEIVTGATIGSRSLVPRRAMRGRCSYLAGRHFDLNPTAEQAERVILRLLAGFVTETVLYGVASAWLSSFDIGGTCMWAEHIAGPAAHAGVDRVQRRARELVLANWDLVNALAIALLDHGRLRTTEIQSIAAGVIALRSGNGEEPVDA